ncbi:hypothetical protein AJ79_10337 [Helicocarpus griseus UAMH5409]|uniref:Uncharacterized protein n=1 Tax=Helicocarpus griseus UAMH5409 TaxID=1447875 RepID=A0A2B7WEN4_9EURO|nr:hypothetical protein AJ79_10337 [Helicocarpus griseus UAMH5409]
MAESSEASEGPLATPSVYASGLKQALRAEFEGLRGQIDTSLKALEGRLSAFENQINTQLEALEAKFTLLSPQNTLSEQLKLPKHPQDPQGPLQAPDTPRAKTTHEPPSRATSARPGRAAAPELTPIPRTSEPRPGTPPVQPRWADIAAGEQSGWKTVGKRRRTAAKVSEDAQSGTIRPGDLKPAKGEHKEDRRLIFRRSDPKASPKASREDIILTLNRFLAQGGFPGFMRVVDANYTETGALSALLDRGALADMLIPAHRDSLLAACRLADPTVIAVELNEQWHQVKMHKVSVSCYGTDPADLTLAHEKIETGTNYHLMRNPIWLWPLKAVRDQGLCFSTIVITVKGLSDAQRLAADGLHFAGTQHHTSPYYEIGKDSVCLRCCGIGHESFEACGDCPLSCLICAGPHEAA